MLTTRGVPSRGSPLAVVAETGDARDTDVPREVRGQAVAERHRYRWMMLALLCLGYGSFGLVSASLAPLLSPILSDTGMTRSQMGIVLGSWQFVYLVMAVPVGMLVDRFGLRLTMFAGIALVALSEVLRAGAGGYATMLTAVMVFGLGGPFISVGAPKLAATWFHRDEAGLALGVYTVSPSVGSMIATSTANSLLMPLTGDSWRMTLLIFAAVALAAALAWGLFSRDSPIAPVPVQGSRAPGVVEGFRRLARIRVMQVVLLMAVGCFLFNHSITNWLPEILRSRSMSASEAGFWASVPTLVAIGGALVVPRYTSERWLAWVQVSVFALWACGALLLAVGEGVLLYVGLVCIGIGRGAATPLLMLTLLRSSAIGPLLMGAAGGLFFTAGEVGGVLGPTLTGFLADWTGSYALGLQALAAVSVVLAGLALLLGIELRRTAVSGRATEA